MVEFKCEAHGVKERYHLMMVVLFFNIALLIQGIKDLPSDKSSTILSYLPFLERYWYPERCVSLVLLNIRSDSILSIIGI